jgi:hypothetical protein
MVGEIRNGFSPEPEIIIGRSANGYIAERVGGWAPRVQAVCPEGGRGFFSFLLQPRK